jgi:hypothetical protein
LGKRTTSGKNRNTLGEHFFSAIGVRLHTYCVLHMWLSIRVTRWVFLKIAQNVARPILWQNKYVTFTVEKSSTNLSKLPKENNRSKGRNSSSLDTLLKMQVPGGRRGKLFEIQILSTFVRKKCPKTQFQVTLPAKQGDQIVRIFANGANFIPLSICF